MRNRLRNAISVALVAIYATAGIGGDAFHYLFESPDSANSAAMAGATGHIYAHQHGHDHGPGGHWHFHRVSDTQREAEKLASAKAPAAKTEAAARFADPDEHDHSCLLLALVSTLELTLSAATEDCLEPLIVLQDASSPQEIHFSPVHGSHSARGPPHSAMA